jgi:hypothetical protein
MRKQVMNESRRKHFEDLRQIAMKEKEEKAIKKQEEIQRTLEKCKEIEEIKLYEFNKKMCEMERQKKLLEKQKEEELQRKVIEAKNRELKIIHTREEKEKLDNLKKEYVIDKISQTEQKIKIMKEIKEIELMQKNETNILRRTEREMNIKRIENVKEYERQIAMQRLEKNYDKADQFKEQKFFIGEKKKEINMEIAMKKKEMAYKLETYIRKNSDVKVNLFLFFIFYLFYYNFIL